MGGEHGHSEERVVWRSSLGPNLPLSTNAPDRTPDTPQPQPPHVAANFAFSKYFCLAADSFSRSVYSTVCKEYYCRGTGRGNYCVVATDIGQSRRSSGVPYHVTTRASKPLFVPRVATRYPTGSNKAQAKSLVACRPSLCVRVTTYERLGWSSHKFSRVLHLMGTPKLGRSPNGCAY
jgi:hypothetical protein